jgi:hypothetical protein
MNIDEGAFVLAKTMLLSSVCTVDLGEALGLYRVISWVCDNRFDNVDFVLHSNSGGHRQ